MIERGDERTPRTDFQNKRGRMRSGLAQVVIIPEQNERQDVAAEMLDLWNHRAGEVEMLQFVQQVSRFARGKRRLRQPYCWERSPLYRRD